MSSDKKKPPLDSKKALAQLKQLKVPSVASYDGRKTLTKSQKATIKRNYEKYGAIAQAKSEYTSKDISHYDSRDKKALINAGYKIIGNKLYADKQGFKDVKVTRSLQKINGKYEHFVEVERSAPGERPEKEFISSNINVAGLRERLVAEYSAGDFKPDDFVGMKIGSNGRFKRVIMHSPNDLYKYWVDDFEPHDTRTNKEELSQHLILVKISKREGRGPDIFHETTIKQKNKVRRQRAKNSANKSIIGRVNKKK